MSVWFVFEMGSIKNQIVQSEISQFLRRTLAFSIWGTFSKRSWVLMAHQNQHVSWSKVGSYNDYRILYAHIEG